MNDVLHNIIQALEKLVMHGGATTNGMVPALITQAQDDLAKAKTALAAQQGEAPAEPVADPPPVVEPAPPVEEPPAPVPEAPPPADPAPEAAAPDPTDNEADALNAAEEEGLEQAAPPAQQQPAS